jgi:hypothetical protein
VALVARQLAPAVGDLCAILGIEVGYRDPGVKLFGLENSVMPVGDTFLEVVSPIEHDTAAGRFLDRRRGDGGYMVIVQSNDLAPHRRRLEALGVRIVWETTLADIETIHLHPRDVGGAILSLDVARPPESWRWAGPDWKSRVRTDVTTAITGVELQAGDPAALASRWSQVLDRPAVPHGAGHEIPLDTGVIRFVPDDDRRGDGISALDVAVADRARLEEAARARGAYLNRDELSICGVRIRMH